MKIEQNNLTEFCKAWLTLTLYPESIEILKSNNGYSLDIISNKFENLKCYVISDKNNNIIGIDKTKELSLIDCNKLKNYTINESLNKVCKILKIK